MSAKSKSPKLEEVISPLPISEALLKSHADPILTSIQNWKKQNRVPPVLLLAGLQGIGKREIAYYIAQTLLCENAGFTQPETASLFGGATPTNEGSGMPCGTCPSCERALSGNFLDFREVQTEKDSQTLKIDQFREIKESQGYSGFNGSYRIFLISQAERLTHQAANSLLKILEEPPPGWVFLLTVSDTSLLPTTVVSRCQVLRLKPLPEEVIRSLLQDQGITADRLETCVKLSQGSFGRALETAQDEVWGKRSQIFLFLENPHSQLSALVDWAALDHRNLILLLDQFEQILLDLILASQTTEPAKYTWLNQDGKQVLAKIFEATVKKLGPKQAPAFWMGRSERIFSMRRELTTPLNHKLLIQDFLIPWL